MEVGDWWQQVVNTIENTTHAIPTSRPGRLAVFPGSHVHLAINHRITYQAVMKVCAVCAVATDMVGLA